MRLVCSVWPCARAIQVLPYPRLSHGMGSATQAHAFFLPTRGPACAAACQHAPRVEGPAGAPQTGWRIMTCEAETSGHMGALGSSSDEGSGACIAGLQLAAFRAPLRSADVHSCGGHLCLRAPLMRVLTRSELRLGCSKAWLSA